MDSKLNQPEGFPVDLTEKRIDAIIDKVLMGLNMPDPGVKQGSHVMRPRKKRR